MVRCEASVSACQIGLHFSGRRQLSHPLILINLCLWWGQLLKWACCNLNTGSPLLLPFEAINRTVTYKLTLQASWLLSTWIFSVLLVCLIKDIPGWFIFPGISPEIVSRLKPHLPNLDYVSKTHFVFSGSATAFQFSPLTTAWEAIISVRVK